MAEYLFDEILLSPDIFLGGEGSSPVSGSPEFANTIIRNPGTGARKVNVSRFDALEVLTFDLALLTQTHLAYLLKIWRGGYGNAVGLRVRVPWDYTMTDQVIGTVSAGSTTVLNLVKTYTRPGVSERQDVRRIIKPVTNSNLATGSVTLYEPDGVTSRVISVPFSVKVGGASTGFTYTVNNTTGAISITTTTTSGTVTVTCEFDVPCAFEDNSFPIQPFDVASEVKGIRLMEIHYSELGIE